MSIPCEMLMPENYCAQCSGELCCWKMNSSENRSNFCDRARRGNRIHLFRLQERDWWILSMCRLILRRRQTQSAWLNVILVRRKRFSATPSALMPQLRTVSHSVNSSAWLKWIDFFKQFVTWHNIIQRLFWVLLADCFSQIFNMWLLKPRPLRERV